MKKGKFLGSSPKKQTNPLKIIAIVLSIMAALSVLAAVGAGVFVWYSGRVRGGMFVSRENPPDPRLPSDTPAPAEVTAPPVCADWVDEDGNAYRYRDDVISILLMGIDYMGSEKNWSSGMESNGGNADVLGLVILDTGTFDFSILYIPRDTMTDVIAMDRDGKYIDTIFTNISAAHSYGDGKDLSCRLTADAVSRLLCGAPVNRYAALDYDALYVLSDILGGLTLTLDDDYTVIHPAFTRGSTVTLDSRYLRRFVAYRDESAPEGAYERGLRSMAVLKAMFAQIKESISDDPSAALDYYSALKGYITTDLTLGEMIYLARNMGKMDFGPDTVVRLPGETVLGPHYAEFYPDKAWIHDFTASRFCTPAE